ncbi:hypothetical protein CIG75_07335 [Tumebacillus algifaecis]|uniref:Uncharacterized protein n=1 Tax=Tumebacillus algifaecis TaxID=1214604 RepID=A0A223CZC1_9BACL|nr:hypothetical protein [Tumebacillus algifaecis]ASS74809.1 hypothetical protein CIG75_07335 [Tumebacillus algifaecis]
MKKLKAITIAAVFAGTVGIAVFLLGQDQGFTVKIKEIVRPTTVDFEFVKESEYPITVGNASMQTYDTLESMYNRAVIVAEIKVQNQETIYTSENPPSVLTCSNAVIKQIFKGDKSLKTVKISETGGVVDMSKSKGNEMRSDGKPLKSEPFVESTIEGSPVMKKGNTYLVFLKESAPGDPYTIVGSVQGKIRIDDVSNKGVVTIDPERFAKQMDLFWLQRKFAGKDTVEIAQTLRGL